MLLNDIKSQNLDVIVVTETWLKGLRDLLLFLDGYEKFSRPANEREKGVGSIKQKPCFREKVNIFCSGLDPTSYVMVH